MSHHVIEYDEACPECGASGLYVGMAEREGAAIVCHCCDGTGKHSVMIEYDDFTGRRERRGITRVLETNPGFTISGKRPGFGGLPYAEWLAGQPFPPGSEMREHTCPAWWSQCVNDDRKPEWPECIKSGPFRDCRHFPGKAHCWARWDQEQAAKREAANGGD